MLYGIVRTKPDTALTLLRLALGVVMFPHGAQKMLGWFGGHGFQASMGSFEHQGIPAPLAFLAIAAEFFGGLGLIVGFLTRIASFGVLCNMVVAILLVHARNGFFMNWSGQQKGEGFEFHILAIAMAMAILLGGAGAASVDWVITRGRARKKGVEKSLDAAR